MNLLELQRRMAEDVRRSLTPDWEMQRATDDGTSVEAIAESYVKPNDRLSSFERLEIYNRQYWFRVIGAVSEDFPALKAMLGEKRFDAMVLAYLREVPSTSWTLRDLSGKLPDWLAGHPEFPGSRRQQLALDIAALEWAYIESYDGRRLEPLAAEDMHAVGAETSLMLQPHLQLLALRYPVDELVLAVRKDTPEMDIVSNAASEEKMAGRRKSAERIRLPKMRKKTVYLAVHRFDDVVYYRHIDREAFALLIALREGIPLAEALGCAFERSRLKPEKQAAMIQEYFAHAAELGWFCRAEDGALSSRVH